MKLSDLRTLFRSEAHDKKVPYLWSNNEILDYGIDAQNEACRRGRLLVDSRTSEICTISLRADVASYGVDSRVIFVRRARLVSDKSKLTLGSYRDFDTVNGTSAGWQEDTGTPTHLITDMDTGYLRAYPIPNDDDSAQLTVVRLPLQDLAGDDDEPEINPRFHRSLRHWMLYRAYMRQDADTFDPDKAAKALTLFELEFGKPSRAVEEEWILRQHQTDDFAGVF